MRLKLVLLASLIAALVGVGSTSAIILLVFSSLNPASAPGILLALTYLDTNAGDLAGSNICLSTHRTPAPVAGCAYRSHQSAVNVWNLSGLVVRQRSPFERPIAASA